MSIMVLKLICNYQLFSTKLYAREIFVLRELRTIFQGRAKKSFRTRDDLYPVCRLDIRKDCQFATGYGYQKTAFKREPASDPDDRTAFIGISRIKLHIAQSFIYYFQKHLFILLCHDSEFVYGVNSVLQCNPIPPL